MRFCLCFESELTQIGLPLTSDLLSELVLHTSCIVSTVPLQPLESSARTSNGRFADPTMARENLIAQKICARFDRKNLALVWV